MLNILFTFFIVALIIVLALFVPGGIFAAVTLIKKYGKRIKDTVDRFRVVINY